MSSFGTGTDDRQQHHADIETLLRRAMEMVDTAKSMPLSASVIIPRDELRNVLEACLDNLPLEIRQANWMVRERAEFLAKMEREGDEILRAARERAERLVQRSELVKEAHRTAERLVTEAQDEARHLKHEAEDYCDQKLASFEGILERTWRTVQGGRDRLRGAPVVTLPDTNSAAAHDENEEVLFDQDASDR
jgi:cell division septum initiation protein DivIVA